MCGRTSLVGKHTKRTLSVLADGVIPANSSNFYKKYVWHAGMSAIDDGLMYV